MRISGGFRDLLLNVNHHGGTDEWWLYLAGAVLSRQPVPYHLQQGRHAVCRLRISMGMSAPEPAVLM